MRAKHVGQMNTRGLLWFRQYGTATGFAKDVEALNTWKSITLYLVMAKAMGLAVGTT